jgi:taurine transport system permease protein
VSTLLLAPDHQTVAATPTAPRRPRRDTRRSRRIGVRVLATLALLGLWQLLYALNIWSPVLLPSPGAVWDALIRTSTTHDGVVGYQGHYLWEHLAISLGRIGLGSVLGVAAGLAVGLVMGMLPWARVIVEPWVAFLRVLPPLAYFSLLIIWFGIDESPKIWLLAIAAMPPVAVATTAAVVGAPATLVEAARAMGARGWQITSTVVLPSALPEIATGVRLAVGIAYSSLVAAETVNGLPGLGGMIRDAQTYLQSDVVILGLFAIGLSGLLIDGCLRAIERRLVPWRGRG